MKTYQLNPDSKPREKLQDDLRVRIKDAISKEEVSLNEVVFLLTRMLPELCEAPVAFGHFSAAYDLAKIHGTEPALKCSDFPADYKMVA